MKFGFRTPNIKSSVRARTTGRLKRSVKRAVIPGYGKKGMGWVNNPRKAAYNKVYHQTTFGVQDILNTNNKSTHKNVKSSNTQARHYSAQQPPRQAKRKKVSVPVGSHPTTRSERITETIVWMVLLLIAIFIIFLMDISTVFNWILTAICVAFATFFIVDAWKRTETTEYKRVYKDELDNGNANEFQEHRKDLIEKSNKKLNQIQANNNDLYAKAVFLNAYKHSPLLSETGKAYYRYIETECGINSPAEYHRQLIADGYLAADEKDASCYSLTEKGKQFLQDHSDCVLVHKNRNKFNMDWDEYVRAKAKLGDHFRYFDVVWGILNERTLKSGGCHAYEYHQMYTLLKMEGRKKDALEYLLNFLYLELNNTESIKICIDLASHPYTVEIMTKDSWPGYFLQLTAHNLKELNELKEFYSEDMAERVFQKMQRFSVVICDLATFKSIIKSIFNGTYNEEKVNSKLRRKWNAFIKSLQNS